jgi:N-acylglucosamine 2-epimerase
MVDVLLGKIFNTAKLIWLQGHQAWIFSMLYNKVDLRRGWPKIAKSGSDFLVK